MPIEAISKEGFAMHGTRTPARGPLGRAPLLFSMLASSLLLGACLHEPLPYSPNYSHVTLTDESEVLAHPGKGYDKGVIPPRPAARKVRQAQTVLVPDACITPDTAEQPVYLPSGCANNLNLQIMVERPKELVQGRRPGPATAAPTVRAAERYLYEGTDSERRAARFQTRAEPPPAPSSPSLPQGSRTDSR
jgi:hypothetical protein